MGNCCQLREAPKQQNTEGALDPESLDLICKSSPKNSTTFKTVAGDTDDPKCTISKASLQQSLFCLQIDRVAMTL